MTAPAVTKRQAVFPFGRFTPTENSVIFELAYEDTGQIYRQVIMTTQHWEELGSPQEITVTIEPGSVIEAAQEVEVPSDDQH